MTTIASIYWENILIRGGIAVAALLIFTVFLFLYLIILRIILDKINSKKLLPPDLLSLLATKENIKAIGIHSLGFRYGVCFLAIGIFGAIGLLTYWILHKVEAPYAVIIVIIVSLFFILVGSGLMSLSPMRNTINPLFIVLHEDGISYSKDGGLKTVNWAGIFSIKMNGVEYQFYETTIQTKFNCMIEFSGGDFISINEGLCNALEIIELIYQNKRPYQPEKPARGLAPG